MTAKRTMGGEGKPAISEWVSLGYNVQGRREEHFLTLRVDLRDKGFDSNSGKSRVIASTQGNVKLKAQAGLDFDGALGVNLYQKK